MEPLTKKKLAALGSLRKSDSSALGAEPRDFKTEQGPSFSHSAFKKISFICPMCSIPILWWKCLKNSQHLIWLGHSWLSPSPEMECPDSASHRPQAPIEVIEQGEPGSESGGVLSSLSWAPEDKHHPLPVVLGPIHQQRPKPSASTKMTLKNLLKRQTPKSKDAERKRKLYNKC